MSVTELAVGVMSVTLVAVEVSCLLRRLLLRCHVT